MKITKPMFWLKSILVLSLVFSFTLTATAQDYYPTTIGNTWVFLSADGAERRTYSIEESDTETDEEAGIFILRILTETLGTDTVDDDVYYISDDAGDLKLHRTRLAEGAFGIAAAMLDPPGLFFPADLPLGRTWDIVTVTELDLVGTATTTSTIEVVEVGPLGTPIGTFENCVKLEIQRKSVTRLGTQRTTSYQWLAPDVGPVKYEDDQGIVYEFQSYNLVEETPAVETPEEPMVETPAETETPEEPAVETPVPPKVEDAVISLKSSSITAPAVGEQLKIDVNITGGKGIASYGMLLAYDSTALKYIDATDGNYLPKGGIWIRPALSDDGSYELKLSLGDSTQSGKSISTPLLEPGEFSVDNFFFGIPEPPPAEFVMPDAQYRAISILASSPLDANGNLMSADGDGTLVTFTFEVVEAKQTNVALVNVNLSDINDAPLGAVGQGDEFIFSVLTISAPAESSFDIALESGLNMISIPLMPAESYTAKSLAAKLGASVVIKLDAAKQSFIGYSVAENGEGFGIDGSSGYIVNTSAGGVVTFTGTAWQKQSDAAAAAPKVSTAQNAWAFVITSDLQGKETDGTYTVIAKNLRTGVIATKNVANDKESVSAVWADLNRKSVVKVGDKLEVTLLDKRGTIVSGPFQRTVTTSDIHNAYLSVQMQVGDVRLKETILGQNFPNPFNPETWIPYQLSQDSNVTIQIYNISGSSIRTLNLGHKSIGSYMTTSTAAYWDGKNDAGEHVSSGIYFYTLQTKNFSATRRMVILK